MIDQRDGRTQGSSARHIGAHSGFESMLFRAFVLAGSFDVLSMGALVRLQIFEAAFLVSLGVEFVAVTAAMSRSVGHKQSSMSMT
jgi:hypothetical protein